MAKKSIWFLVLVRLQNCCGDKLFCCCFFSNLFIFVANQWNTWYTYTVIGTRLISHTQSMVAKRILSNWANTARKKSNWSSNFGCNWKLKMSCTETRNWRLFFGGGGGWPEGTIQGYWIQTKFPIHKVWWLRETNVQKLFKTHCSRIPTDPAILTAIGMKSKNADARSVAMRAWDQKPDTCSLALIRTGN